jgi:hypothetical protein
MKKSSTKNPRLSIVVLSYNTREILHKCLLSLNKVRGEIAFEVIVVDNGSNDGSVDLVKNNFPQIRLIENKINRGFAGGNNSARGYCKGKYVLFLNSDTQVFENTLKSTVEYLDKHKSVGALTCKLLLPGGGLDKDARRAFVNPWIGLTHLFLRLDRIFPKSKIFARYWYGYVPEDKIHTVDVIQGAYFLTKKSLLDSLGWFDEDYFMDGEDIDLCWRIRQKGYKIVYYPKVSIIHFKGLSKGKVESENRGKVPLASRLRFRLSGVGSMEIFYKKHLWQRYPLAINLIVILGVYVMKTLRLIRTVLIG